MNRLRWTLWAALAMTWLAMPARAQGPDINVNVFVNYGFAYRDNTWVPVEVHVRNERETVKGYIEVRTRNGQDALGPVYRLPIESPKGSNKRFQLHCYMSGATEVRVQIYHGRRAVLAIPYTLPVQPIRPDDLLGLVLDESSGAGFGFLYMAVNRMNRDRGFHRECLTNSELPFLSDQAQSYEPLDVIVVGECEVDRVGLRQRQLIQDFVRRGGRLAVCTGKHAKLYRGTWLEELLGVRIGAEETVSELALAQGAFPADLRRGARDTRDCIVAHLTPVESEVNTLGSGRVLATRRPFGAGAVYTLAVDAEDAALQECEGYGELWREIALGRSRRPQPAFPAATAYAAEALPRISGIVVHSKASVMTYLALYFVIGVVGNWLFFSWLKRREWAWATLVVFSVGFTAYAMVFGTTGRARVSEIEQIDIVRVVPGGGLARRDTLMGVLTAHTTRYAMALQNDALAQDLQGMMGPMVFRGQPQGPRRPFTFVGGDSPRLEDFRVGASELRLLHIEGDAEYPGGIEGRVTLNSSRIRGEFTNRTGRTVEQAFLVANGRIVPLRVEGDRMWIENEQAWQFASAVQPVAPWMYQPGRGGSRVSEDVLLQALPSILLSKGDDRGIFYSHYRDFNAISIDPAYGPLICAWSRGTDDVAALDAPMAKNVNWTLLMAEVEVEAKGEDGFRWEELEAWAVRGDSESLFPQPSFGGAPSRPALALAPELSFTCVSTGEVKVLLTEADLAKNPLDICVDLYWTGAEDHTLVFWPESHREGTGQEFLVSDAAQPDGRSRKTTYRLPNWKEHLQDWDPLKYQVVPMSNMASMRRGMGAPGSLLSRAEEFGIVAPPPYDAPGEPVKVLSGVLGRHPQEGACPSERSHLFFAVVAARAKYPIGGGTTGETLPWQ